jgi:signal transduction histidine kinase
VPLQTDVLLVRAAYVFVLAVMFVHFDAHQRWQFDEISGLLSPESDASHETAAARCLARVRAIFGTNRAMLAFSDPNEPWITLAVLTDDGYRESRELPMIAGSEGLAPSVAFSTSDAARPSASILTRDKRSRRLPLKIPHELVEHLGIRSALAAPVRGQLTDGILILPDLPRATSDDLLRGEILGIYCATTLDRMYLAEEMARGAASAERVGLARDLHDSVLQSITGARLRIESMLQSPSVGAELRSQLAALSDALALEYVSLRSYIQALSPKDAPRRSGAVDLSNGVAELLGPLGAQWGIKLRVVPPPEGSTVSPAVFRQISLLLNETVSNAARHGGATAVNVDMAADNRKITINIKDNGKGFRPYGRYAHEQLIEKSIGSESLRRRVAALSGAMSMSSSASGVAITVVIPYPALVAAHAD